VDLHQLPTWDEKTSTLSGASRTVAKEPYKVIIAANGRAVKQCSAEGAAVRFRVFDQEHSLIELSLESSEGKTVPWQIEFE
jgi:hypothetical protein